MVLVLPNTFLLTNLPSSLQSTRALRVWIGSPPRSIHQMQNTAVVQLGHHEAASRFMVAFKHFRQHLIQNENEHKDFQAFLVPVNPEIPLPPVMPMDGTDRLGDQLWQSYQYLSKQHHARDEQKKESQRKDAMELDAPIVSQDVTSETNGEQPKPEAEGTYDADEDEDPLDSPQIKALVRKFREFLEQQQGEKAVRRKALVAKRLGDAVRRIRLRIADGGSTRASVAPPPPPSNMHVPPSGQRGVSNLPAWMTQQQQQQLEQQPTPPQDTTSIPLPTTDAMEPPPAKKIRLDESFPSLTLDAQKKELRDFVGESIEKLLGEREETLIDFVYQHVLDQKTPQDLLPELQDVLDEDAKGFVDSLVDRVSRM